MSKKQFTPQQKRELLSKKGQKRRKKLEEQKDYEFTRFLELLTRFRKIQQNDCPFYFAVKNGIDVLKKKTEKLTEILNELEDIEKNLDKIEEELEKYKVIL